MNMSSKTYDVLNCKLNDNLSFTSDNNSLNASAGWVGDAVSTNAVHTMNTGWGWWQGYYYPQIIRESYPVYLQDRAKDSGKQAFEIIKALQDKKLMKLDKVSDFIEAMDTLIKVL